MEAAIRRNISIRVDIIRIKQHQRVEPDKQMLISLGMKDDSIGYDEMRRIGRGGQNIDSGSDQLCGHCADGILSISPNEEV